ncbi:exonuclease 1 [Trichonephila clavipes]|nr:exonuclease 1 [Trichonephila clavipes]
MGNINVKTMEEFDAFSANSSPVINEDKSIVWGSQSSSSSRASNKIELSAFKYSTPKQKKYVSKKRQFAEMADCGGEATCTDEELFSMYINADAKRNHIENASSEEDPLAEESSLASSVVSSEASAFQSSPHPKILNLPFRKIVRSRFFAAETTPDMDSTLADCISLSEESKTENDSFLSNCNITESLETDSENITEDANSPLKLEISSPKRDNKENIAHRFAKKNKLDVKQSLVSSDDCDINSQEDKLKSDSWLNIIDEECSATTSTISSTGKSNKLLDIKSDTSKPECNISSSHKKIPKKFITTKIRDFKWTKDKVSEVKFNSSLGSDGNSFSESLEESFITENERTSIESIVSPYFNSSAILNNDVDSESGVILPNESEESNTLKIEVEHSTLNSPSIPKNQLNKSLNTLKTKSKPGRCRTLGLSKNRKNSEKVPRKETLLNFNFVRQPKKEGPAVL